MFVKLVEVYVVPLCLEMLSRLGTSYSFMYQSHS